MDGSLITAEPEQVGFSRERLAVVDAMTHRYVDEGRLPCVVTVIARHGEVIHHDRYGWADVESGRPVADDDLFRIYSMTKPITSIALMQLYEQGLVLLENPVSRFIPEFADTQVWASGTKDDYTTVPPTRPMTVHDVLTHMSGLTAAFQWSHPVDAIYRDHGIGDLTRPEMSLTEGCQLAAGLPLLFSPGTSWGYGLSTDVVGRIVEVVSGLPLDQYLRQHILDPLGMHDTEFWVDPGKLDRLTTNYVRNKGKQLRAINSREKPKGIDERPNYLSGAGGLISTAAEYQRFLSALANGGALEGTRIIGPRTLAFMAQNHLPEGRDLNQMGQATFSEAAMEGTGFGLGFSVVTDPAAGRSLGSVGEYGWGGAASTAMWLDPHEELTCLFLTQLVPSNVYPIRRQLRATVYQALVD
jgi:CubicO group peptidase (beta-lactamase class C family)